MTDDALLALDAYWRAANYLTVGQIYLRENALLREPYPSRASGRGGGHERQEAGMQVGMIGLGRMGANMVRRLLRGGHRCMVHAFLGGLRLWNGVPARPARRG